MFMIVNLMKLQKILQQAHYYSFLKIHKKKNMMNKIFSLIIILMMKVKRHLIKQRKIKIYIKMKVQRKLKRKKILSMMKNPLLKFLKQIIMKMGIQIQKKKKY